MMDDARQQDLQPPTTVLRLPVIEPVLVLGIPIEFILFALTLLGVALFHKYRFDHR